MTALKIAIFSAMAHEREFFERINSRFGFNIAYCQEPLSIKTCHLAAGCDVACLFVNDDANAEVIDQLHRMGIKLLALRSTGYNHVDLKAAKGKIPVVNVPRYSPHSVAEFTLGLILALNRKLHLSALRVKQHNFSIEGLMGFDLYGKSAGVVGAGAIGKRVIAILQGLGMQVRAYDIDKTQVEKAGAPFASLEELYRTSDILTLHCPLTEENRHMISSEAFDQMKRGAMLINAGRGGLIDTRGLIYALEAEQIGSAGLDVYENEGPYFYRDLSNHPLKDLHLERLLSFQNVIITSHYAFFTREAMETIVATTLESVREFSEGKSLSNVV